jgi:hypothetical protein
MVRFNGHAFLHLPDRHLSHPGQQLREHTFMGGIHVLHQDKGEARRGGDVLEQLRECLQTASGGANPHNGKGRSGRWLERGCFWLCSLGSTRR